MIGEKVAITRAEIQKVRCHVEPPKSEPALLVQECKDFGFKTGQHKVISVVEIAWNLDFIDIYVRLCVV